MSQPPGPSAPEAPELPSAALVAEACQRSGLVWLRRLDADAGTRADLSARVDPGARAYPAWHVWHQGAVLVVTGPGEQPLPPLVGADEPGADATGTDETSAGPQVAVVVPGKDSGMQLLTFAARARVLTPGTPQWTEAAAVLKAGRLNARDSAGLLERWAAQCRVVALEPTGELLSGPDDHDGTSLAAPPAPTPATTAFSRPFHLGGRRARRRR